MKFIIFGTLIALFAVVVFIWIFLAYKTIEDLKEKQVVKRREEYIKSRAEQFLNKKETK